MAATMKSCQICAGNVPPATLIPCTFVIGICSSWIADPDRCRKRGRVAHEPGIREVIRGARLSRRRPAEVGCRAGARQDVLLQDLGHLVSDAVPEDALALRLSPTGVGIDFAAREHNLLDRHRLGVDAAGGERRIGGSHVEHGDGVRPEPDRRDRLEPRLDPHLVRDPDNVLRADVERQPRVDGVVRAKRRGRNRRGAVVVTRVGGDIPGLAERIRLPVERRREVHGRVRVDALVGSPLSERRS